MEVAGFFVAVLALVVAWLSWRAAKGANRISGESNEIARQALSLSEAEDARREEDRRARARLAVTVEPGPNHELGEDGAIWTSAGTIITTLVITIANSGERPAGTTHVDVWLPRMPLGEPFWAESSGGPELSGVSKATPDPSVRLNLGGGAPLYESVHLSRRLGHVAVEISERIFLRAPFAVEDVENAYPIDVVVRAEGADKEATTRQVLRIKRR